MKVSVEVELPELPPGVAETHGQILLSDGSKICGPVYWTRARSELGWRFCDSGDHFSLQDVFYVLPLPKPWNLADAIDQHVAKSGPLSWENPLLVKLRDGGWGVVDRDLRKWCPDSEWPFEGRDNTGMQACWRRDGRVTTSAECDMDIVGPWEGA